MKVQDAISAILATEGFEAMARDCKKVDDDDRELLQRYARIALKNAPEPFKYKIKFRFVRLGLL